MLGSFIFGRSMFDNRVLWIQDDLVGEFGLIFYSKVKTIERKNFKLKKNLKKKKNPQESLEKDTE